MAKVNWEAVSSDNQKGNGNWTIFPDLCKGCGLCIEKCPVKCIRWSEGLGVYGTPRVQAGMDKCIACGICQLVCPDCAIKVERKK
jgi:2-oxoglutarate ferredoxin oxidoreductase subunit delta